MFKYFDIVLTYSYFCVTITSVPYFSKMHLLINKKYIKFSNKKVHKLILKINMLKFFNIFIVMLQCQSTYRATSLLGQPERLLRIFLELSNVKFHILNMLTNLTLDLTFWMSCHQMARYVMRHCTCFKSHT